MLHKLNYPLLGLLAQLLLSPVLVLARLLGFLHWSWGTVLGLPLTLAAGGVVLGLLEHLVVQAALAQRRLAQPSRRAAGLPGLSYGLPGLPRPQQASSGNIRK